VVVSLNQHLHFIFQSLVNSDMCGRQPQCVVNAFLLHLKTKCTRQSQVHSCSKRVIRLQLGLREERVCIVAIALVFLHVRMWGINWYSVSQSTVLAELKGKKNENNNYWAVLSPSLRESIPMDGEYSRISDQLLSFSALSMLVGSSDP